MSDESENPIHIEASRARLRRLAKKRWGDDKTDDELATELVELVHSEFPANTLNSLTTGTVLKPSSKHSLYAVIDLKETVIGGFDNPQLMTKEDAENLAKNRYPNHSDDFIDSLIIKWNATQITFRSSGSVFDLDKNNPIVTHDDGEVRPIKSESDMKEAIEKCQSSMSKNSKAGLKERIFRLLSSDEDNLAIKRGLHKNLDDIIADRDQIRKHQITLRRDWLNDPKNAPSSFNEEGKLVTELKGKKNCEEAGGTNPGMVTGKSGGIPNPDEIEDEEIRDSAERALKYMGLEPGTPIESINIDRVFVGSCTNGRLEDLREVARIVNGKRVHSSVHAMVVPGSTAVRRQAELEGLDRVFTDAGFEWREAGCSMCIGMNPDTLSAGERCASTTNRNFEGRQGRGGRTHLVSPATAAATALAGRFTDPRSG